MRPTRPTISRDTRVLLTIVVISVATLWALARLRFPDRIPTPNPIPPVIAQLATPPSTFDDIALAVTEIEERLQPSLLGLEVERRRGATGSDVTRTTVSALRFRDDLAVTALGPPTIEGFDPTVVDAVEVARDRASQIAVVRLPGSAAPVLSTWSARRPPAPRFLVGADASATGLSLRPVFVGSLREIVTPIWSEPAWDLPEGTGLSPGTFVFTTNSELAGLVIDRGGRSALVPARALLGLADRLSGEVRRPPGHLGVEVQPLSAPLAAATGARAGVVVTWVDSQGAAARELRAADVVESIDGSPTPTVEHWSARIGRVTEGESLLVTIRRDGELRDAHLIAGAAIERRDRPLGLGLQTIPRIGVEIVRVDPGSAAAAAGLQVGDVLTVVRNVEAPTALQASRAFTTASRDRPIIIALTRSGVHRVLSLERTW